MELRTCPFCGGEAEIIENKDTYRVECNCGCRMGDFYEKEDAVSAWNERQQP